MIGQIGASDEPIRTMKAAVDAKGEGIHVYAIAVGLDISEELKSIASPPWKDNVFVTKDFNNLDALNSKLFDVISDVCPRK